MCAPGRNPVGVAALRRRVGRGSPRHGRAPERRLPSPSAGRSRATRGVPRSRGRAWPLCSVGLRPEVDEPDRLDARRAHLVELADALRLAVEIAIELFEATAPGAHVGFELALLLVAEVEGQLPELVALVPGELLAHPLALTLEGFAQVLLLALAALLELLDGERCEFLRTRLELGQKVLYVAGGRVEQLALDRLAGHAAAGAAERTLEEVERLRFCVPRVVLKHLLALRRLDPARRDRHQLLVQSLRALTIEREAAQKDHARDRVRGLRETGARKVVVNEALGAKAGQQPLGDPLLEVQVNSVLRQHAPVLEDDWPDRRLAAPVGDLLVLFSG